MGRFSYSTRPGGVLSGPRLHNYTGPTMTGAELKAIEANKEHAGLVAGNADRQEKKHVLKVIEAVKEILKQKDKRKRPRRVRKKPWKAARKMRLTRTKRHKSKAKKHSLCVRVAVEDKGRLR